MPSLIAELRYQALRVANAVLPGASNHNGSSKGSSSSEEKPAHFVVAGAGLFGCRIVRNMLDELRVRSLDGDSRRVQITLLSDRAEAAYVVAALRCAVGSAAGNVASRREAQDALVPLEPLFRDAPPNAIQCRVVVGRLVAIDSEHSVATYEPLQTDNNNNNRSELVRVTLDYDALLIATGLNWPEPLFAAPSSEACLAVFDDWQKRIAASHHVVVVGGGAVGIELLGEIHDVHPNMQLSLVHGSNMPLAPPWRDSLRKTLHNKLNAIGVEQFYDARGTVKKLDDGRHRVKVERSDGTTVELVCDVVFESRPASPNTEMIPRAWCDARGFVPVLSTFQPTSAVRDGIENVLAAGDITTFDDQTPEHKMAARATFQSATVARNALSLAQQHADATQRSICEQKHDAGCTNPTCMAARTREPQWTVSRYRSMLRDVIVVTLGRHDGAGQVGILVFGGWLTAWLKGADLMLQGFRSLLNAA